MFPIFDGRTPLTKETMNDLARQLNRGGRVVGGNAIDSVSLGTSGKNQSSSRGFLYQGFWAKIEEEQVHSDGVTYYRVIQQQQRPDGTWLPVEAPVKNRDGNFYAVEQNHRRAPLGSIQFMRTGMMTPERFSGDVFTDIFVFDTTFKGMWIRTTKKTGRFHDWTEQTPGPNGSFVTPANPLVGSYPENPAIEQSGMADQEGIYWAIPGPPSDARSVAPGTVPTWLFFSGAAKVRVWRCFTLPVLAGTGFGPFPVFPDFYFNNYKFAFVAVQDPPSVPQFQLDNPGWTAGGGILAQYDPSVPFTGNPFLPAIVSFRIRIGFSGGSPSPAHVFMIGPGDSGDFEVISSAYLPSASSGDTFTISGSKTINSSSGIDTVSGPVIASLGVSYGRFRDTSGGLFTPPAYPGVNFLDGEVSVEYAYTTTGVVGK